jgi:hypothetical protein
MRPTVPGFQRSSRGSFETTEGGVREEEAKKAQVETFSSNGMPWPTVRRLMLRLLSDAIIGYIRGDEDETSWLFRENDAEYAFSIQTVCYVLDVDHSSLLGAVERKRKYLRSHHTDDERIPLEEILEFQEDV